MQIISQSILQLFMELPHICYPPTVPNLSEEFIELVKIWKQRGCYGYHSLLHYCVFNLQEVLREAEEGFEEVLFVECVSGGADEGEEKE